MNRQYVEIDIPCLDCGKLVTTYVRLGDPIPKNTDTPYTWCQECEEKVYQREYALFKEWGLIK